MFVSRGKKKRRKYKKEKQEEFTYIYVTNVSKSCIRFASTEIIVAGINWLARQNTTIAFEMKITRLNFKLAEYCIDEKSRLSSDIIRIGRKKKREEGGKKRKKW